LRGTWPTEETLWGKIKHLGNIAKDAVNGVFGEYELLPRYRKIWKCITYSAIAIAIFAFIILPLFNLWLNVVDYINWVYWGI
jgi:hypothetical protein